MKQTLNLGLKLQYTYQVNELYSLYCFAIDVLCGQCSSERVLQYCFWVCYTTVWWNAWERYDYCSNISALWFCSLAEDYILKLLLIVQKKILKKKICKGSDYFTQFVWLYFVEKWLLGGCFIVFYIYTIQNTV